MKASALCAFLVCVLAAAAPAQVSLWNGTAPAKANTVATAPAVEVPANLLREVKARNFEIHDIIAVIVTVAAEAATEEEADLEKKSNDEMTIAKYLKLKYEDPTDMSLKSVKPDDLGAEASSSRKYENEGSNERTDLLRTRVAAEIVDRKPNGNLVIEAKHKFTKQRETTTITLSGTIRPQDVMPDNSVFSFNVADADIRYESSGPVTDASKRGWLTRIVDKVWPF